MTGYKSKKAAAQAKTIDEVNWADHEPNGLAQPAQAKLTQNAFDEWWDSNHNLNEINPCMYHSFEYWAWEGWHAALAQPAQEPVAWRTFDGEGGYDYRAYDMNEHYAEEWNKRNPNHKGWVEALYTTPPQRHWVGLTDEETSGFTQHEMAVVKYVSKVLQDKNT